MRPSAESRVKKAAPLVPELVRMVKRVHPKQPFAIQRLAVLDAWRALACVVGWTPEMVDEVERRMRPAGK